MRGCDHCARSSNSSAQLPCGSAHAPCAAEGGRGAAPMCSRGRAGRYTSSTAALWQRPHLERVPLGGVVIVLGVRVRLVGLLDHALVLAGAVVPQVLLGQGAVCRGGEEGQAGSAHCSHLAA